jgi:hypothetical protein
MALPAAKAAGRTEMPRLLTARGGGSRGWSGGSVRCEIDPGRGAGIPPGPFAWTVPRNGRARRRASGAPQALRAWCSHGRWGNGEGIAAPRWR